MRRKRVHESEVQEDAAKLKALRDAAMLGFDAIERGEYLALRSDQDVEDFVRAATGRHRQVHLHLSPDLKPQTHQCQ